MHVAIIQNIQQGTTTPNDIQILIDGVDRISVHGTCCPYISGSTTFDAGQDILPQQSVQGVDHSYNVGVPNNVATIKFGPSVNVVKIAGIRIWDTVLNASTLTAWKDQCVEQDHPNFANLKHDFELDQGSGASVTDGFQSSQTATVSSGLTWWSDAIQGSATSNSATTQQSNAALCSACPHGTFAEQVGLSTCTACPSGKNTTTIASANASHCV